MRFAINYNLSWWIIQNCIRTICERRILWRYLFSRTRYENPSDKVSTSYNGRKNSLQGGGRFSACFAFVFLVLAYEDAMGEELFRGGIFCRKYPVGVWWVALEIIRQTRWKRSPGVFKILVISSSVMSIWARVLSLIRYASEVDGFIRD